MLKDELTAHLRDRLIPFWEGLRDERYGGYYGWVDYDLAVDKAAPKGGILNSRILWFFSSAYRALGEPRLLDDARHAYRFLCDHLWDSVNGGVYWSCAADGAPLETMKHTYAQSFAIYGLSTYALACGEREPLERAMALYELIERRMRDEIGYCEAFERDFAPLSDNGKLGDNPRLIAKGLSAEKTMNTMLHVLEAYTVLYEASRDARVCASTLALLKTVRDRVYNERENRLEVFFDRDMRSLLDMQSFGHDIEASWLIDRAADVLDAPDKDEIKRWTTRLAQGVYERAFTGRCLLNEQVEGEIDPTRIWWVQAETIVGLTNLWQKTGDAAVRASVEAEWAYVRDHLADSRPGSEWFWELDERDQPVARPIVEPWKCPYHNGRMCMELMARL